MKTTEEPATSFTVFLAMVTIMIFVLITGVVVHNDILSRT